MQKLRCHYTSPEAFLQALASPETDQALEVFTTTPFEPGEELLLELFFAGLPGKMMIRAVGQSWHAARPRLRVRAGGIVRCAGSEWGKLQFLARVARGEIELTARRKHMRLPVLVEIRWREADRPEFHPAAMSEVSQGGALVLTQDELQPGQDIVIEVLPPGSELPLEILAAVRNTDHPDGVGVEFVARDAGGVHRLREVIRRIVEQ